ncbi:translation initiation factor IF-2-like [Choloepus didactylus]|uniref:translation initiation factor IF-2-like n=1 Tax=Choloepus didactylus TaxID=27675 RepID=UPI0018A0620C|nr:translation initiation factor IF-2-like [Choloepus didactylus]
MNKRITDNQVFGTGRPGGGASAIAVTPGPWEERLLLKEGPREEAGRGRGRQGAPGAGPRPGSLSCVRAARPRPGPWTAAGSRSPAQTRTSCLAGLLWPLPAPALGLPAPLFPRGQGWLPAEAAPPGSADRASPQPAPARTPSTQTPPGSAATATDAGAAQSGDHGGTGRGREDALSASFSP